MGGVAGDPVAGGFADAPHLRAINGNERVIARLAGLHFDENDEISASRNNVDLAAVGCIGLREYLPAGQAQPEAREKLRFNTQSAGAATIL
jgi:hypothetical protein